VFEQCEKFDLKYKDKLSVHGKKVSQAILE